MSYSLGDDKESFDIYDETKYISNKLAEKFIELGWKLEINERYKVLKNGDRTLTIDVSQDHITDIYIEDNKIDYDKFCIKNNGFEILYTSFESKPCGVVFYRPKESEISNIVKKFDNAPLKNLEESEEEDYEI